MLLFLALTLLTNYAETVFVPVPEFTRQSVHVDEHTARHVLLLFDTLRYNLQNMLTTSMETIHMDKPYYYNDIQTTEGNKTASTNSAREEAEIVEELANVLKDAPLSTTSKPNKLYIFKQLMDKIGMDGCVQDLAKLADSATKTALMTTFCHLTGHNETHIKKCLDRRLPPQERSAQILDTWGRPSAGIYWSGPFFWLGAYDQCLSLSEITANESLHYCRANVHVKTPSVARQIPLFYGMCLPVRCKENHVRQAFSIASRFLKQISGILIVTNSTVECYKQRASFFEKLGFSQWIILAILMLLISMVICGSLADWYRKRHNQKYTVNEDSACPGRTSESASNVQADGDTKSFIYTDAPSQVLTYKSMPAVRRTFKRWSCLLNTILAFSARSSYRYLMRPNKRHLMSIHGIRVLSAFWVVIGHAHLFSLEYTGNVRQLWSSLIACKHLSQIILNSSLSVDSFLLISGTVLAYKTNFRIMHRKEGKLSKTNLSPCAWFTLYAHRTVRLIPAYVIALLVIYYLFQYVGDGPMWSHNDGVFGARCTSDDIWQQLLFVSNFYPNECMPWMWYLALDTQFYLVAPFTFLLLHNMPKIGSAVIFIIILASIIYRAVVIFVFRFPTTLASALMGSDGLATHSLEKMFKYLYASPQARIGPFFIGILLGWLLAKKPKKIYSTFHINILRIACFVMLGFSLFGAHYTTHYYGFSNFYASTFRVFWASGLALLVWLCEQGFLYPVHLFLAWNKWIFLSRLSYGFYLAHEPILLYFIWTRRSAIMPSSPIYFVVFAMEISALSVLAAIFIAFIVEIPPLIIERKLFKTIRLYARLKTKNEDNESNGIRFGSVKRPHNRRDDKLVELIPMLPSLCRTEQWVEENYAIIPENAKHKNLPTGSNSTNGEHDGIGRNRKYDSQSDLTSIGNISTCRTSSNVSINGKQIYKGHSQEKNEPGIPSLQNFILTDRPLCLSNPNSTNGTKPKAETLGTGNAEISTKNMIKHPVVVNVTANRPSTYEISAERKHSNRTFPLNHIGFSWVEEMERNMVAGETTSLQCLNNRKQRMRMDTKNQFEQYVNTLPSKKRASPSGETSSSANTGETVSIQYLVIAFFTQRSELDDINEAL